MNRKALITTLTLVALSPIAQSADTAASKEFERAFAAPVATIAAPQTDALWSNLSDAQDLRRDEIVAERAAATIDQGIAREASSVRAPVTADLVDLNQLRRDLLEDIRVEIIAGVMADSNATLLKVRRSIADARRQAFFGRSL